MRTPFLRPFVFVLAGSVLTLVSCNGQETNTGPDVAHVPAAVQAESTPASEGDALMANDPAIRALDGFAKSQNIEPVKAAGGQWRTNLAKPPKAEFDTTKQYLWLLETSEGDVTVKLFPDVAPMHVSSTIYLTRLGFYDGLAFHRIIPGFMAQGGCPLGNGMGGPGYKYEGEYDPAVRHDRPGLLSMANAGPGTDGSQFFLTFVPTPHLNGKHTIFGEVIEGLDVLPKLAAKGSPQGKTSGQVMLEKATIVVKAAEKQ